MNNKKEKEEVIDGEIVEEDNTEKLSKADIVLPVNIDGMKEAWKRFLQVKESLLDSDRVKYNKYGYLAKPDEAGKDFIVKSGWRKVATAFNLTIDQNIGTPNKVWGEDSEGKYYTWLFPISPIRVIAPNGRYVDSVGVCSSRKPFFSKKGDTRIDPSEEDIVLMAQTVGINRGISDMVGGGEVSGEEMIGKQTSTNNKSKTKSKGEFDWSKIDLNAIPKWGYGKNRKTPPIVKRLFAIANRLITDKDEIKDTFYSITKKEHSYEYNYGDIKKYMNFYKSWKKARRRIYQKLKMILKNMNLRAALNYQSLFERIIR